MFSNILIYFVVIPLLMLLGLALCQNIKQIRAVALCGFMVMVRAAQHTPCGRC